MSVRITVQYRVLVILRLDTSVNHLSWMWDLTTTPWPSPWIKAHQSYLSILLFVLFGKHWLTHKWFKKKWEAKIKNNVLTVSSVPYHWEGGKLGKGRAEGAAKKERSSHRFPVSLCCWYVLVLTPWQDISWIFHKQWKGISSLIHLNVYGKIVLWLECDISSLINMLFNSMTYKMPGNDLNYNQLVCKFSAIGLKKFSEASY